MGSFLSRFRKQPTTLEQLKKIEDGLRKIEDYKRNTERAQKKTIANVIIYSAALYILACVIVFVWYLPESSHVRLALLIPLVLVPVIIYWMKRLISRYFNSKMIKANEDYTDLQRKKKDIIDSVMETETFNKAKEILKKYAPEKLEKKDTPKSNVPEPGKTSLPDLRRRNVVQTTTSTSAPSLRSSPPRPLSVQPHVGETSLVPQRAFNPTSIRSSAPLPEPLFPKDRSFTDKLVEYIIGDGPSYRFALICKYCKGHNGMALKEEFPYMAYNCCYCMMFNAARSQRPLAPRLPEPAKLPSLPPADTKQSDDQPSDCEPDKEEKLPTVTEAEPLAAESSHDEPEIKEKGTAKNEELDVPDDESLYSEVQEIVNTESEERIRKLIEDEMLKELKKQNVKHTEDTEIKELRTQKHNNSKFNCEILETPPKKDAEEGCKQIEEHGEKTIDSLKSEIECHFSEIKEITENHDDCSNSILQFEHVSEIEEDRKHQDVNDINKDSVKYEAKSH